MSAPGELRNWNQAEFDALPYDSNYCPHCNAVAYKATMISAGPAEFQSGSKAQDPWLKFNTIVSCQECNKLYGSYDGC